MKTLCKILLLALLFIACKMTENNENIKPKKKANILEHTKWQASATSINDVDSILDFHTGKDVKEYIILNGNETLGRQGIYKIKKRRVEIKWSQLITDHTAGIIKGKTMELTYGNGIKIVRYHKIGEY